MDRRSNLAERSSLTGAQLDSLLLRQRVLKKEITSGEAARLRSPNPVSLGAYHRVVRQAQRNLEASILTILVGVQTGLIDDADIKRLVDLVPRELNIEDSRNTDVSNVISVIVRKIVTG